MLLGLAENNFVTPLILFIRVTGNFRLKNYYMKCIQNGFLAWINFRRGQTVPLLVKLVDNGITYVTKDVFSELVSEGKIVVFKRPSSNEWIDPKIGPLRGHGSQRTYTGPERRSRF